MRGKAGPGLTLNDVAGGPPFYIVGVRESGDRIVVEDARTRAAGETRIAELLAAGLEGYQEIRVESVAEHLDAER
jgi:hypothetical protein